MLPPEIEVLAVAQRSEAWIAARLGRLTASRAGDMLARVKSGEAASRRTLRLQLVLERLTGRSQERAVLTPAMQEGIDREADARGAYEAETGALVETVGFLAHRTLMVGASLDGHLGDFEHLLSIKCRQPAAHYEFLRTGAIPADALAQMRHEAWLTGAARHEYVSWQPDFPPPLRLRRRVLRREELDIEAYAAEALAFLREVDREEAAVRELAEAGVL